MIQMSVRLAQADRRQNIHDEIRAQSLQCKFLRITYNLTLAKYYMPETPGEYYEEILEPVRLELNACIDKLEELQNTEQYGPDLPVDVVPGVTLRETPEFPFPEPPDNGTEEAPGGGPTTIVPWAPEVPEPTTEPIPPPPVSEPAPPEIPMTSAPQPSAAAVCDPMYGTFYDPRTGQCRGSVSGMPTTPFTSFGSPGTVPLTQAGPASEGASSFMGQVQIAKSKVRRSFGVLSLRRSF